MNRNHYETLGVSKAATSADIRAAYFVLAQRYHPDLHPNEEVEQSFKEIQTAYEVLSDPELRLTYDHSPGRIAKREVVQTPVRPMDAKPSSELQYYASFQARMISSTDRGRYWVPTFFLAITFAVVFFLGVSVQSGFESWRQGSFNSVQPFSSSGSAVPGTPDYLGNQPNLETHPAPADSKLRSDSSTSESGRIGLNDGAGVDRAGQMVDEQFALNNLEDQSVLDELYASAADVDFHNLLPLEPFPDSVPAWDLPEPDPPHPTQDLWSENEPEEHLDRDLVEPIVLSSADIPVTRPAILQRQSGSADHSDALAGAIAPFVDGSSDATLNQYNSMHALQQRAWRAQPRYKSGAGALLMNKPPEWSNPALPTTMSRSGFHRSAEAVLPQSQYGKLQLHPPAHPWYHPSQDYSETASDDYRDMGNWQPNGPSTVDFGNSSSSEYGVRRPVPAGPQMNAFRHLNSVHSTRVPQLQTQIPSSPRASDHSHSSSTTAW